MISVDNVKVSYLRKKGYRNILEWLDTPGNMYIGRKMRISVKRSSLRGQVSNDKYTIYDNNKSKSTVLVIIHQSEFHNPLSSKKLIKKYNGWKNTYQLYINNDPKLKEILDESDFNKLPDIDFKRIIYKLKNKNLGCWCSPNPCHGDVLKEFYKIRLLNKILS